MIKKINHLKIKKTMEKQLVNFNQEYINTLVQAQIIPAGTPPAIIKVFSEICNVHNLSPAKKEIFLLPYNVRINDKWEVRYATIIGRDGLRIKAQRTGNLAGIDQPVYDDNKTIAMFQPGELPLSCAVTVYRLVSGQRCAFTASVRFSEFSSGKQKWSSMPFHMIAKVAECHALKMAFGEETAGLNIEEEIPAFENVTIESQEQPIESISHSINKVENIDQLKCIYEDLKRNNQLNPEISKLLTDRKKEIQSHARKPVNA